MCLVCIIFTACFADGAYRCCDGIVRFVLAMVSEYTCFADVSVRGAASEGIIAWDYKYEDKVMFIPYPLFAS